MLAGRSFLVTGASRGIGRQVALSAAAAGAHVVASGRDVGRLEALAAAAAERGGHITMWPADLSAAGAVATMAAEVGVPDVVVNCAAAPLRRVPVLSDQSADVLAEQMAVNVLVPLALLQSFGDTMVARRSGVFVFVSSVASKMPQPLLAAYSASKAAMDSLMRTAALELGPAQVRCNSVAPGLVDTERTHDLIESSPVGEMQRRATPLGRLAQPDDIAQVVLWLASDEARFVTGQVITVDGGSTAGRFHGPSDPPDRSHR